jgi:hypothetical protein
MADSPHRAYLWSVAAFTLAAGCVLTVVTAGKLADCRASMERRMADYRALSELDARLRHMETAMATWQERHPGPPAPISTLATGILSEVKIEMRELQSSNAVPGVLVRTVEVACQDVPFDRAMQLVQRLDGLWPRWVLVHMEAKSTDQPGTGRLLMRFESLSSPDAGPVVLARPVGPEPPAAAKPDRKPEPESHGQAPRPQPSAPPVPPTQPSMTNPGSPGGWTKTNNPGQ